MFLYPILSMGCIRSDKFWNNFMKNILLCILIEKKCLKDLLDRYKINIIINSISTSKIAESCIYPKTLC